MLVSVRVKRLALDPTNDTPVVILGGDEDDRELPIWIGPAEASSIALRLSGKRVVRPHTHDLMTRVIAGFGGKLTRVAIDHIEGGVIHAKLFLEREGRTFTLDARPPDSVAVALRSGAEIVVDDAFLTAPVAEFEEWRQPPSGWEWLAQEEWEDEPADEADDAGES